MKTFDEEHIESPKKKLVDEYKEQDNKLICQNQSRNSYLMNFFKEERIDGDGIDLDIIVQI